MSRYLLDTDTITLAHYGQAAVVQHLAAHLDADVAVPALSVQEQMRGWLAHLSHLRTRPQMADWYDFLVNRMFPIWKRYALLPFPEPAILRYEHLKTLRLNVGAMDLRIAAVALENGLTVVTRNRRDFGRVPGLTTEDWSV
ncbi:MAG TPA: type II toxin-antitoxin system VapC family toxin [Gemmataceae bacterium]|nr:type II toxin-antitoxin system VapC family toxin [Gemmataceae bacterium]